MKGFIFTIVLIWVCTIAIGVVVWETKTDMAEGLLISLGTTALLTLAETQLVGIVSKIKVKKEEYYIKWY